MPDKLENRVSYLLSPTDFVKRLSAERVIAHLTEQGWVQTELRYLAYLFKKEVNCVASTMRLVTITVPYDVENDKEYGSRMLHALSAIASNNSFFPEFSYAGPINNLKQVIELIELITDNYTRGFVAEKR